MAVVSAHEQEHVANAQAEGSKEGAELLSANVKLTSTVCPECGSSYISGGTTTRLNILKAILMAGQKRQLRVAY